MTYEFSYETEEYGEIIITAFVEDKLLNIWLRTSDNMGLSHFVVGYNILNDSEEHIRKELIRLINAEYFDSSIELALEEENILENREY
jgi:hypothetical protein